MRTVVLAAFVATCAFGQHNTLTPAEAKQGWRLMFDGRTMKGWLDPAKKDKPGNAWYIEDGCLKTRPKAIVSEDLISEESFGDFEMKFDWRLTPGANTGVKYRIQRAIFIDLAQHAREKGGFEAWLGREITEKRSDRRRLGSGAQAQEYTVAFEMQLIDDERHRDALKDASHTTGALYSMLAPARHQARPAGEWNEGRIVLRGNRFEHWINGVKVLEGALDDPAVRAGVEKRWGPAPEIREALLNPKPRGPVSLQHHGDEVWFRDVKIRELR